VCSSAGLRFGHQPLQGGEYYWGLGVGQSRLRIDDRDNRSPIDPYIYIAGDSELQNAAANSARRRFNIAPSYRDSLYALGAGILVAVAIVFSE
jgi:hypothetical protein